MSFVRYLNLVILGILGRLATTVNKDSINLLKTLMFCCMQNINCIPNFVLEISQKHKFFWVLETGLVKHIKTVKKVVSTCRKFRCLSACAKNQLHRSQLSWDIAKLLHSCYVEYFRHAWLHPSDMAVPTFWMLWNLSLQKSALSLTSFSRCCNDFENLLFWVLWARLAILILIVSTCKKVCLSTLKKSTPCLSSFFFFNWDSLHARLNNHYEAWSYKKKKHKKDYNIQEICVARTYI